MVEFVYLVYIFLQDPEVIPKNTQPLTGFPLPPYDVQVIMIQSLGVFWCKYMLSICEELLLSLVVLLSVRVFSLCVRVVSVYCRRVFSGRDRECLVLESV